MIADNLIKIFKHIDLNRIRRHKQPELIGKWHTLSRVSPVDRFLGHDLYLLSSQSKAKHRILRHRKNARSLYLFKLLRIAAGRIAEPDNQGSPSGDSPEKYFKQWKRVIK